MARIFKKLLKQFFKNQQHADDLNFLKNIPIFSSLTNRQFSRILLTMQKRRYTAGETLFQEGQIGKAVFVIKSGVVELSRRGANGKARLLGRLGPGHIFGEMALLENRPRTASAVVVEDGDIYLLYTASLERFIKRHPHIGVKIMRNMAMMLSALLRRTNMEVDQKAQSVS